MSDEGKLGAPAERFEREPRVRLPSREWEYLSSTVMEEGDDDASTEGQIIRPLRTFADRYDVLQTLSRGHFADVKLCKDRPFAREVAMKVLRSDIENASARWRFFREARVQGQLSHPAVVPVYDLGVDPSGSLYFTMKRVQGLRFDSALLDLREGRDPPAFTERQLLSRMAQVCLAVHYAHCRGVIHRDLKPSNIMLGEFGEVYVLDWGLAKVLSDVNSTYEPIQDASGARQTSDGSVLGTIGFMAPEQLQGEVDQVSTHSDVYSLGAMLFELLAGETVHRGSIAMQALSSLQTDGASPRARSPERDIPEVLDEVCFASLRSDQANRLEHARDIADAIEQHLAGS